MVANSIINKLTEGLLFSIKQDKLKLSKLH